MWRIFVLFTLCYSVQSLCPGYAPYPGRWMQNITCPTNLFTCTANDVTGHVVEAHVIGDNRCRCDIGNCQDSYLNISFVMLVETTGNIRYDITVFISNDGESIAPPVSQQCIGWVAMIGEGVGHYDNASCSAWANFTAQDSDACGDIKKTDGPVYANITAQVSCVNIDVNGQLSVPSVLAWHVNSGSDCSLNVSSGPGSKCVSQNFNFTGLLAVCDTKVCPATDQCGSWSCVPMNGTGVCVKTAFTNQTCDDGLYCTTSSHCNSTGYCVATSYLDCGPSGVPCNQLVCQEIVNGSICSSQDLPNGSGCSTGSACYENGQCVSGVCNETHVHCPTNLTCTGYVCNEGVGCEPFYHTGTPCGVNDPCQTHICNDAGLCVDTFSDAGTPCGAGDRPCQFEDECDGIGNCDLGDIKPNGTLCSPCFGCQQASYCNGTSLSCPNPQLQPCANVSCQVGTCFSNGTCGCDYSDLVCTDNDACTDSFCNVTTGQCFNPLQQCPPPNTPPNECIVYSCDPEATNNSCIATSLAGERCSSGDQCFYGVCVQFQNTTSCITNPYDPIPPPPAPECTYYTCDPDVGFESVCNATSPCQTGDLCYNLVCQSNVSTQECDCIIDSAISHPADTACTKYFCNTSVGWVPDYQDGAHCGNHNSTVCRNPDTCLQGVCVNNFENTSTLCEGETDCLNAAYCNGFGLCSNQTSKSNGTSCGPSHGECDPGDICSSGVCVHNYDPYGTECDGQAVCHSHDICDGEGNCIDGDAFPDGTSCGVSEICGSRNCSNGQCISILINGTLCDPSTDVCQLSSYCSGDNFFCPPLQPVDEGTLCRTGSGCTSDAHCDGQNSFCPNVTALDCDDSNFCTEDSCFYNSSSGQSSCVNSNMTCADLETCFDFTCSPSEGCLANQTQCHTNNTCQSHICVNGTGCVFDPLEEGTECDDGDVCTINDRCDGNSSCIADPLCLSSQCLLASCQSGICFYDPANETESCVPDSAETCGFESTSCLSGYACSDGLCQPVYLPFGTLCREAVSECDASDYCTGQSACCPFDSVQPDGTLCNSGQHICGSEQCVSGVCSPVPSPAQTICNVSTDVCFTDGLCNGTSIDGCQPQPPIVPCCHDDTECNITDYCDLVVHICKPRPQGCQITGCASDIGCIFGICNNETFECDFFEDDQFCVTEDVCLNFACNPKNVCLTGIHVSTNCSSDLDCSRPETVLEYWSCSSDLAHYPSQQLCEVVCTNGTCSFVVEVLPEINGTCGPLSQSGCEYTPVENCCYEDLDCENANITDCTFFTCTNHNCSAFNVSAPDCCIVTEDCGPNTTACSYFNCSNQVCEELMVADCCLEASDCGTIPPGNCSFFNCTENVCMLTNLSTCCGNGILDPGEECEVGVPSRKRQFGDDTLIIHFTQTDCIDCTIVRETVDTTIITDPEGEALGVLAGVGSLAAVLFGIYYASVFAARRRRTVVLTATATSGSFRK